MTHGLSLRAVLSGATVLLLVFFASPIIVVIACSFSSSAFLSFPPPGLSGRWYTQLLAEPQYITAIELSFVLALLAATISTVLGMMAALALARWRFPGRDAIASAMLTPLILPQIIIGAALLQYLGAIGLGGNFLGLLLGHVVITLPYVIRTVESTLVGFNRRVEEASADLGADGLRTLWHITLPLIKAGVIAGWLFAFVISWINVEVSIFLVPSVQAPLPVQIFNYIQYNVDPSIAVVSAVSVYVAVAMLLVIDRFVRLDRVAQ